MIAIGFVYFLFCGCFVIVNSQSTVDETSGECSNDEYMYVLQTVERTCGPTRQLFDRHEQLLKQLGVCPVDDQHVFTVKHNRKW